MQSTNNRTYITGGIIAVIVIALIVGAYYFDHRNAAVTPETESTSTGSMMSLGTSTASSTGSTPIKTSSKPATPAAPGISSGDSDIIQLETFTLYSKSSTADWTVYSNSAFKFSLKYPALGSSIRKMVDGNNSEYAVGITLKSGSSHFNDKYFELMTDTGVTTVCDALLEKDTKAKSAIINGVYFIRNEYSDNTAHVIEYTVRSHGTCYSGNLRLNGASDVNVANLSSAEIKTESQILEDIMSTFVLTK